MTLAIDESVGVNGVRLHARVEGTEGAPCVVLAHALGANLKIWDAQIPALAPHYRVLRYDARGHGSSETPRGPYTLDLLADDLLSLMRFFEFESAHVVGISLGALTALAASLLRAPEIKSLTVCNTRVIVTEDFAAAIDARNALILEQGIAAIADEHTARWLAPKTMASRPDLVEKVRAMLLEATPDGFAACADAVKTHTLADHIGAIKVPALLIAAEQDVRLPAAVMRAMQQQMADAEFAEVRDAGHLANLEQPEAFNAILLRFLARVST